MNVTPFFLRNEKRQLQQKGLCWRTENGGRMFWPHDGIFGRDHTLVITPELKDDKACFVGEPDWNFEARLLFWCIPSYYSKP